MLNYRASLQTVSTKHHWDEVSRKRAVPVGNFVK